MRFLLPILFLSGCAAKCPNTCPSPTSPLPLNSTVTNNGIRVEITRNQAAKATLREAEVVVSAQLRMLDK